MNLLIDNKENLNKNRYNDTDPQWQWNFLNLNQTSAEKTAPVNPTDFEKYIISITTDANYNTTSEYSDAFVAFDLENRHHAHIPTINENLNSEKEYVEYVSTIDNFTVHENSTSPINRKPIKGSVKEEDIFSSFFGFLFKDEEPMEKSTQMASPQSLTKQQNNQQILNHTDLKKDNEVPLILLNILNVTKEKKENTTKIEIPQRKNNKIINRDETSEELFDDIDKTLATSATSTASTVNHQPQIAATIPQTSEVLRSVLLATLNGGIPVSSLSGSSQNVPPILPRPLNSEISFIPSDVPPIPAVNIESKSKFQYNPIRSELDLIVPDLYKPDNDINHNYHAGNQYQLLPSDSSISNTESYVVNPVDLNKLKQHQSEGQATIITKPSNKNTQDPAGILKLAGCNIYGRMYRVGRIISELSNPCLLCKCTEVGVNCTPLVC